MGSMLLLLSKCEIELLGYQRKKGNIWTYKCSIKKKESMHMFFRKKNIYLDSKSLEQRSSEIPFKLAKVRLYT